MPTTSIVMLMAKSSEAATQGGISLQTDLHMRSHVREQQSLRKFPVTELIRYSKFVLFNIVSSLIISVNFK
jgi:hypothetical protein